MAIQAAAQPMQRQFMEPALLFPIDMQGVAKDIIYESIISAITAKILSLHSFAGGFCFGTCAWLADRGIDAVYAIAQINTDGRVAGLIKIVFKAAICPFIAALATTMIGYPISFSAAVILNFSACAISITAVVFSVLAGIAIVAGNAGIAILRRMYNDKCNARQAIENIRNDDLQNRDNQMANALRAMDQVQGAFNRILGREPNPQRQNCG